MGSRKKQISTLGYADVLAHETRFQTGGRQEGREKGIETNIVSDPRGSSGTILWLTALRHSQKTVFQKLFRKCRRHQRTSSYIMEK